MNFADNSLCVSMLDWGEMCLVEDCSCCQPSGGRRRTEEPRHHLPVILFLVVNLQTQQAGVANAACLELTGWRRDWGRGGRQGLQRSMGILSGPEDCPHLSTWRSWQGRGFFKFHSGQGLCTLLSPQPRFTIFLLPESEVPSMFSRSENKAKQGTVSNTLDGERGRGGSGKGAGLEVLCAASWTGAVYVVISVAPIHPLLPSACYLPTRPHLPIKTHSLNLS